MALKDYYDRINHVGVPTEDMAATVRFYTDLGFTLIYETKNGDQQVCFLENGSIQIEAYTVEHAANARGAIDHLALKHFPTFSARGNMLFLPSLSTFLPSSRF